MLHQQAWAFLIAFLTGITSAVIFDIYRVIRRLMGLRKIGTVMGDFFTLVVIALAAFGLLLMGNWAEMRLYVAVAIACGLTVYFRTASQWMQRSVYATIKALGWAVRTVIKGIILPFQLALKLVQIPLGILAWMSHLVLRISQYLVSFPQLAVFRWYSKLIGRFSPPPEP